MPISSRNILFVISIFCLVVAIKASAQDLPDVAQGLQPYAAYHGGQLDKVNTLNGSLSVRIPLVSYPQKGSLELSFSVVNTPFVYRMIVQCPSGDDGEIIEGCSGGSGHVGPSPIGTVLGGLGTRLVVDQALSAVGVSVVDPLTAGFGTPNPMMFGRYYVVSSDNAQHPLGRVADGSGFRSVDRAGYFFAPSSLANYPTQLGVGDPMNPGDSITQRASGTAGTITDPQGRVYTSTNITDPDGNTIQVGDPTVANSIIDSIGRSLPTSTTAVDPNTQCPTLAGAGSQVPTSAVAWSVPGPNSAPATYIFCYTSVPVSTHFIGIVPTASITQFSTTYTLIQSIVLPNHQHWGFVYGDGLGNLTTLYYPTGGWVTYNYQPSAPFCDSVRNANSPSTVLTFSQAVTTRTEYDASGAVVGTWSYTEASNYPDEHHGVVVTPTHREVEYYPSDGTTCGLTAAGTTVYSDTTGTTALKSENITFAYPPVTGYPEVNTPYPVSTTTILNGVPISTVAEQMDAGVNFQEYECQWPTTTYCEVLPVAAVPLGSKISTITSDSSGTILKQEQQHYLWQSNASYLAANLTTLPDWNKVLDGSSSVIETTSYSYDESAYSPGGYRGHATSVSKTLDMASGPAPTTHTGWNEHGMVKYTIDADHNVDSYGHTTFHRYEQCDGSVVTSTANALGQTVSGTYDCPTGLLTSLVDLNGNTTSISWDAMRRITNVSYPAISSGTPTTTFVYTDSANTVQKTVAASPDPDQTTTVTFDGLGRETKRISSDAAGGAEVDTTYDGEGRVYTVTNPYHTGDTTYTTATTYDALSRPLVVTKPDTINSVTTSYSVNPVTIGSAPTYNGPTTDSWDENGTHMQHTKDALGRLVKVMELGTTADPRSLETDYAYDALDSLTHVNQIGATGETPRTRSFTYDSLARLIISTNPETGTICYGTWSSGSCVNGYDANGNLLSKTDANGVTMSYTYDALNRVTARQSNGASPIQDSYVYDHNSSSSQNMVGRLAGTVTTISTGYVDPENYFYDAMGRVTQVNSVAPNFAVAQSSLSASYDLAGNVTSLTYPDGRNVTQAYDAAGRLTTVTDSSSGTEYFSNAQYTAAGALASASYGNGVTESITYNSRLQPCHTMAYSPALPPILSPGGAGGSVGNVYDRISSYANNPLSSSACNSEPGNNGNIGYIADNLNVGWTQTFTYDGLDRLTSGARSDGGYNHTYNYDSFGNLLVQDNLNPSLSSNFSINATNQLNRYANGNNVYIYDPAGNLISSGTSDIGGHTFTYNALGQITAGDDGAFFYAYNAQDQRIFDANQASWKNYDYFNGQPLAEFNLGGIWTDYIYAEGQKIAKITAPLGGAGTLNYYLDDHLGTTQVELSSDGHVTWQGQFTPFGSELDTDPTTMHYKFTGKERDTESGLDYFGARYYGSAMGRWMSPDWAAKPEAVPYSSLPDPQSLNLYNYVGNNPLSKADADGHDPVHLCSGASQGAGTCGAGEIMMGPPPPQAHPQAQQNAPHPYVAPTGPGTEIGNILDPAHPSNPGPITSPTDPLGQCVTACRHYEQGLPDHTQWTQGVPVVITVNGKLTINPAVKPGTAIAAGWDASGHYPGPEDSHKNSGVFLGSALIGPAGSIRILDQWPSSPGPRPRDMSPTSRRGAADRSNSSTAYYVIMAP